MQLLSKLASLRFSMYAVFMVVPQGLVRRLATTRHKLTEEEGEESDDDDINPKLLVRDAASCFLVCVSLCTHCVAGHRARHKGSFTPRFRVPCLL